MIQLSDHFTTAKLLRFTLPSIGMMLFTSIYGIVDGFFVSNFVGKTAFAAVNLIIPFLQILGGFGAMLGAGGSALVARTLGEGDNKRASRYFTMMIALMAITGVLFSVVGIAFIRPMAQLFGATAGMLEDCVLYGRVCLIFNTMLLAQYTFQSYLIVAEQPKLGLLVTVLAGFTNMALDYLFMAVFGMGIAGAALATGLSQTVAGVIPFLWFISRRNRSALHFTRTRIQASPVIKACINGMSEMFNSVSGSITGMLYNWQLIHYAGEDGVAAYGVVMYAAFIFVGIFAGFSTGSAPIMGYHYGAGHHEEMKNVLGKSMRILAVSAVGLTVAALLLAQPIAAIFVSYDAQLLAMTVRAFTICSTAVLLMWLNIYASSFFTALNDGMISGAIALVRTLLFPVLCIFTLPLLWKLDGVWLSLAVAEAFSACVSVGFLVANRRRYGY